ncbi:MAG: N-acetylgalactosamine-6-sulfatase, partial [Verrucomicrobiota bacterium]
LTGEGTQDLHPYLYWEFYEKGGRQAVRFGDWKAVRYPMFEGPIELFNLEDDLGETTDLAAQYPEKVEQAIKFMEEAHVPDPNWPVPQLRKKPAPPKKAS